MTPDAPTPDSFAASAGSAIRVGDKLWLKEGRKYYVVTHIVERGAVCDLWGNFGIGAADDWHKAASHSGLRTWEELRARCYWPNAELRNPHQENQ